MIEETSQQVLFSDFLVSFTYGDGGTLHEASTNVFNGTVLPPADLSICKNVKHFRAFRNKN